MMMTKKRRKMIMMRRRRRKRRKKETSQMEMINLKRVKSLWMPPHLLQRQNSLKIRKEVRSKLFVKDFVNML